MSKARVIGPGSAGSTIYHCNVNLNTAGGNKKQGLPFLLDRRTFQHRAVKIKATGNRRDYIFTMNQLGGIGRVEWYPRDGIRPREPYPYKETQYTTNTQLSNVLTCSNDPNNTNYNTFLYTINNNSYIIFPSVSCDPSNINSITMNNSSVFDSLVFPNVTYVPNGPTNGHTGYVFQLLSNLNVEISYCTINIQCSTLNPTQLLISNDGSTHIEIGNNIITASANVCTTPIQNIIYNNIKYNVIATEQQTNSLTIILNENLTQNVMENGSLQCI